MPETVLVGAGLFLCTLRNLQAINVGIAQENLLLFKNQPELNGYKDENAAQLYAQISSPTIALRSEWSRICS